MTDQVERERRFHNQRFSQQAHDRAALTGYYSINAHLEQAYNTKVLAHCAGADLLEIGCGTGEVALFWESLGARVTAIDISDEGIARAQQTAAERGGRVRFLRMDAADLGELPPASFDVVTGISILHHLELERAFRSLARVLRPNGRAFFIEPLGHNPVINLFRRLTPALRSADEHPLRLPELKAARHYFADVQSSHFHLLTLLAVPFRRTPWFSRLLGFLHRSDQALFRAVPWVRRWSWIVILELGSPRDLAG